MRRMLKAMAWILLGAVLGGLATGLYARRLAIAWDRDGSYGNALTRAGSSARVLLELDAGREAGARERLERDLLAALAEADALAGHGADLPLGALFTGPAVQDVGAVLAYARAHNLDPEAIAKAERLQARLCAALSPGSKYRGLCN